MKSLIKAFLAVIIGAVSMVSCLDETMEISPEVPEGTVSYTAYVDGNSTKAELSGNVSMWKGEEWIQIVGRNGNYWFNANVASPSSVAEFTYNGDNGEFKESDVMAVYPAGSVNYGKDFENMVLTNVTVPSDQTPVVDSYDPEAAVAVAYATGNSLKFKNVVSLLKFKMGSDGVKNVTIWGDIPSGEGAVVEEGTLYLQPNSNWMMDGARFAAYFWNSYGNTWVDMTLVPGKTDLYECVAPDGYPNVIFCRMNPATSDNNWDNKWDQTVDLTISGSNNHFTVNDGAWNNASGTWSTYYAAARNGISGTGKVDYNNGNPVMTGASNNYVSMNGTFVKGKTYYIAIAPIVFENGFTVEFSNDGDYNKYEVKSTAKKVEFKRNTIYDLGTLVSGNETGFYTDPAVPDADQPVTIYYRPTSSDDFYGYAEDLYAHIWLKDINGIDVPGCGTTWGDNDPKYKFTNVGTNLWSLTLSPTIREWFGSGETPLQTIGIIARTESTLDGEKIQTGDNFITVTDNRYGVETPLPEGMHHGINYNADGTVTLVLYDRDDNGKGKGYCYLVSELSGWKRDPDYAMHRDDEEGVWWITLTDLDPDKEYMFQYSYGSTSYDDRRTFDPYTEILYDTSNDKWIKSEVYPGLSSSYPASGFISAFQINRPEYDWKVDDYQIEDENDLVIYELLLRDFTDNAYGEGNIKAAMEYLDYLENLGVNAIELMPVQEFDGNDSWGYGTHAYFAMDKVYGTRDDYKAFIDACHQRGMAVLFDVVYNHATGAHPYAALYWDDGANNVTESNPWFFVNATHPYNVYHQWDHSNPMFREYVKKNLEYLIKEYKVDGFRFDLTKGFMPGSGDVEAYNSERVSYLKEYRNHIKSVDPNAVMICEHFVWSENNDLGKAGIKVWQNMNYSFKESAMGWMSNASFEGLRDTGLPFGTLVGYMESHDEERTMAAAEQNGTAAVKASYELRLDRAGINAAFFLLTPGPKMIWQFGELGYDYSIEHNGRTGKKPWVADDYFADQHRRDLYDTYAMLLEFRGNNPRFFDSDAELSWAVGSGNTIGRHIYCKDATGKRFALFGNFGSGEQTISVTLPADGTWYQYDNGAEWNGRSHSPKMAEGQFYLLVNDKSLCRK
ncbi:MAG: hypothetical protein IJ450_05090 [Bacteroidales bacterium]|nr:hypothetical protein [Bacteroidales bacterium]